MCLEDFLEEATNLRIFELSQVEFTLHFVRHINQHVTHYASSPGITFTSITSLCNLCGPRVCVCGGGGGGGGKRRSGPLLENHKLLYVSLEIQV